jgi:hypothetical protein
VAAHRTLAVQLASRHGLSPTTAALRLDYYGLKKRIEATSRKPPSHSPAFVELPSPLVVGKRCLVKLDNGVGASMRLHLIGYELADVEALTRSFWNAG